MSDKGAARSSVGHPSIMMTWSTATTYYRSADSPAERGDDATERVLLPKAQTIVPGPIWCR